jgi:hypothetical protein
MKHKRLMLTALTFLFVGPMLAAWLTYSNGLFLPGHHVNNGTLLQPSLSIDTLKLRNVANQSEAQLRGKWWLMVVTDNPTTPAGQERLYYVRQIRQATGKDRDRIERGLILSQPNSETTHWADKHFPGLHQFTASQAGLATLNAKTPKKLALLQGCLYLVDPLGNIIMYYAPDAAPKGILKDLVRVLKVSQIG